MERQNMTKEYLFKLYLSGRTPRNRRMVKDLKSILDDRFKHQYSLEIIYVTENSASAEGEKVFSTPTLIKQLPPPSSIFVGNFTDKKKLLFAVDVSVQEVD